MQVLESDNVECWIQISHMQPTEMHKTTISDYEQVLVQKREPK